MGRSAITCDNQSRIIHAFASLAPHLDVCADTEKHCVYVEKCQNKEYKHLLQSLGEEPEKPLLGRVKKHELELNAIDLTWLENEAKRSDPQFKPLTRLEEAHAKGVNIRYH